MLRCPKCGNTEKFIGDVVGVATYVQSKNTFEDLGDLDFNENAYICCCKCKHQESVDGFKVYGD